MNLTNFVLFWGYFGGKIQHRSEILGATTGGAKRVAKEMNVLYLGSVPIDENLAMVRFFLLCFKK